MLRSVSVSNSEAEQPGPAGSQHINLPLENIKRQTTEGGTQQTDEPLQGAQVQATEGGTQQTDEPAQIQATEGGTPQTDEPLQGAQIQATEVIMQKRTLKVAVTVCVCIILALLSGVVITGVKLKEVLDLLNRDLTKEFPGLSRKEGIVPDEVWSWIVAAKAEMTLNPNSAHALLEVSGNGKSLYKASMSTPPRAQTDETYRICICVASQNLLNTRAYFEIKVTQTIPWTLGLSTETYDGDSTPDTDPNAGIWTIASASGKIIINDGKATPTLYVTPAVLGLYLDYIQGQVSFYDSVAKRHLHTYLTTFNEKLRFYAAVEVRLEETHEAIISFI